MVNTIAIKPTPYSLSIAYFNQNGLQETATTKCDENSVGLISLALCNDAFSYMDQVELQTIVVENCVSKNVAEQRILSEMLGMLSAYAIIKNIECQVVSEDDWTTNYSNEKIRDKNSWALEQVLSGNIQDYHTEEEILGEEAQAILIGSLFAYREIEENEDIEGESTIEIPNITIDNPADIAKVFGEIMGAIPDVSIDEEINDEE